jgi:hypothetical protein
VTANVRDSIQALLDYNWQDEEADFEAEGCPEGHIFEHMQRIQAWLVQQRIIARQ